MKLQINRLIKSFLTLRAPSEKWPCPEYHIEKEPHFLFIITPPYSGSTALAKILNSSHKSAFLHRTGEGQWLIPGMCQKDRWNPNKPINWKSVRSVWLKQVEFIESLTQSPEVIIEKSPPNMVRIDKLTEIFSNHSVIAFNRNPFANCSSILYREFEADAASEKDRLKIVANIAGAWVVRSQWIRKWIQDWHLTYFTYEEFCTNPENCVSKIAVAVSPIKTVDVKTKIKVKDYKRQRIKNYNKDQISRLSQKEVDAISTVLQGHRELVSFFGYDHRCPK